MIYVIMILAIVNLLLAVPGISEYRKFKKSEEYGCKKDFKFRTLMFIGYGFMRLFHFKRYQSKIFEIYHHRYNSIEKTISFYRAYISNMITACVFVLDITMTFICVYVFRYKATDDVVLFCGLGIVAIVAIVYGQYKQLIAIENNRAESMLAELPNVVNKIVILQACGLPMEPILQRIARDNINDKSPIYREFQTVSTDISNGKGAVKAIQGMNQRCRKPEMTRFTSAIIQNLTHGTEDCALILLNLADEMWKMRRSMDKKRGQMIKEMMLIPTIVCFAIVMLIVIAPAFMGLGSFV